MVLELSSAVYAIKTLYIKKYVVILCKKNTNLLKHWYFDYLI